MISLETGNNLLDEIHAVYLEVFKPSSEEELRLYADINRWRKDLEGGLCILAHYNNAPAGFAVCINRGENLYIWNVGVLESARGKGVWNSMFEYIEKYARDNGFTKMTINTHKSKFPEMFASLPKFGFTQDYEEQSNLGTKTWFYKYIV